MGHEWHQALGVLLRRLAYVKLADCEEGVDKLPSTEVWEALADLDQHLLILRSIDELVDLLTVLIVDFELGRHLLDDRCRYVSICELVFGNVKHQEGFTR
jgi:hypothetical protein